MTELGYMAKLKPEFDKRNTKIIRLSVDPVDKHASWSNDIKEAGVRAELSDDWRHDAERREAFMACCRPICRHQRRPDGRQQTVRQRFVIGPTRRSSLFLSIL